MNKHGILYVVATPIGHLDDITARALNVLQQADLIVAEDTRRSAQLLRYYAINTPMQPLHQHNEVARMGDIVKRIENGSGVALISDAGTPTISDPGYLLVRAVAEANLKVCPVPGACALVTALSAAGMPADKFNFYGFLPIKSKLRMQMLQDIAQSPVTSVVYEAPHRILDLLTNLAAVIGDRSIMIGREISKYFETFYRGNSGEVHQHLTKHTEEVCGEFVVCVSGNSEPKSKDSVELDKILQLLLEELPLHKAAKIAAKITGFPKNSIYQRGLALTHDK